jgi:hypothetical protein
VNNCNNGCISLEQDPAMNKYFDFHFYFHFKIVVHLLILGVALIIMGCTNTNAPIQINILSEMPQKDRARVLDLLVTSNQSRKIGDFRWPFDIRDDNDWLEGIIATIEGYLED